MASSAGRPKVKVRCESVGSSGIRRRKPVHHLPKVSGHAEDIPPNIMWPEPGSAFEASAVSPAGGAKGQWALAQSLARGRPRLRDRQARSTLAMLIGVWLGIVVVIALLAHAHG